MAGWLSILNISRAVHAKTFSDGHRVIKSSSVPVDLHFE